jgi:hypothetical protein
MNMRPNWILFTPLLAAGCAMPPTVVQGPPPVMIAAVLPTKLVETRYDMRSYREAATPSIRHEAHAVFRCTRVPITASDTLETVPRTSSPPASVLPLPASEELGAELATQKRITAELRKAQTSVAEIEQNLSGRARRHSGCANSWSRSTGVSKTWRRPNPHLRLRPQRPLQIPQ